MRVETNTLVVLRWHPQRFHRQVFQRKQKLGFVRQQLIHIPPREPHHQFRIFNLRMRALAGADIPFQLESGQAGDPFEECIDARTVLLHCVYAF